MRQIAKEIVQELAPQNAAQIYNESLQRLVGALQYDIETIVSVSLEDAKNIFNSAQCRRVISDRIMKELKARLDGLEFRILKVQQAKIKLAAFAFVQEMVF